MILCAFLLIIAVILDRLIGDPTYSWHPVRLVGRFVHLLEKVIRSTNIPDLSGGILLTLLTLFFWESVLILLAKVFFLTPVTGFTFTLFILYSCVALRDLARHVIPIISLLKKGDLEKGRSALQMIVGRDTSVLDREGMIRATIETISEGLVDGFLSPVFYFCIFSLAGYPFHQPCLIGIAGGLFYRIINTLDSMIGYKNVSYFHFGRFAAKLDDIMNYIPARMSILFLFLGAWSLKMDETAGLAHTVAYHSFSASPNAGYPESFTSGALHVQLGGPTRYPYGLVEKPFIGEDGPAATPETIHQSLKLITISGYLATGVMASFLLISPFVATHLWI